MNKNNKTILIILSVICISIIIYFKTSTISIPNNTNFKKYIDFNSVPSSIITYYFYDDTIIETSHSSGVLPNGTTSSTITTKYYFDTKIDLTNLENFINKIPRDTSNYGSVEITEKDGTSYYIDDLNIDNKNDSGF